MIEKALDIIHELKTIKGTGSNKQKLKICEENKNILKPIFDIAFNPYRIFGVQKRHKPNSKKKYKNINFTSACAILEKSPKINANFQYLASVIEYNYDKKYHDLLWKIVTKKLRIGVAIKSLNKVGYNLPNFECMLAESNKENSTGSMKFPCYIQPKLDGVRVIRMPDGTLLGRNGKECPNKVLEEHFSHISTNLVLDCEFYCEKEIFDDIIGIYSSDDKKVQNNYKLYCFNAFTQPEWHNQDISVPYGEVLERIQNLEKKYPDFIKNVQNSGTFVNDSDEVPELLEEFIGKGYEGAILRGDEIPYKWKRTTLKEGVMIKLKKQDHADCQILDIVEGKGKFQNTTGALLLDYKGKVVECGSGLTDILRNEIWGNQSKFLGKWCRVSFMEETKEGSLRFPVFESLRDSK